jgi:hypothetical protein
MERVMTTRYVLNAALLFAALSLTGCDSKEVSEAKDIVRAKLRDASSAQFRNVRETAGGTVCGEVNSKNAYGAYTGFEPFFIYLLDQPGFPKQWPITQDEEFIKFYYERECVGK